MKKIGFTMRIDYHSEFNERRDAIDQKWYSFSRACEFVPVLLPNDEFNIKHLEGSLELS